MKFAHYCSCGAKFKGELPTAQYEGVKRLYWDAAHSGPGHEPTDAAKAGRARRKADEEMRLKGINDDIHGLKWTI